MRLAGNRYDGIHRGDVDDGGGRPVRVSPEQFANTQPGARDVDPKMALELVEGGVDNHAPGPDTSTVDQPRDRTHPVEYGRPRGLVGHIVADHVVVTGDVSDNHLVAVVA